MKFKNLRRYVSPHSSRACHSVALRVAEGETATSSASKKSDAIACLWTSPAWPNTLFVFGPMGPSPCLPPVVPRVELIDDAENGFVKYFVGQTSALTDPNACLVLRCAHGTHIAHSRAETIVVHDSFPDGRKDRLLSTARRHSKDHCCAQNERIAFSRCCSDIEASSILLR